jgi:prevent-host-death family protein
MTTITTRDAQKNLSQIILRVRQGEDIVVMNRGKPVIKLSNYIEEKSFDWKSAQYKKITPLPGKLASDIVIENRGSF